MKVGDITEPLRTARGYQILKLEARTGDGRRRRSRRRASRSRDRVFTRSASVEFQKYLEKLRAQAIIEWKNDEVKKAWQSGVAAQTTTSAPSGR